MNVKSPLLPSATSQTRVLTSTQGTRPRNTRPPGSFVDTRGLVTLTREPDVVTFLQRPSQVTPPEATRGGDSVVTEERTRDLSEYRATGTSGPDPKNRPWGDS